MKNYLRFSVLALFCCLCFTEPAGAQFWKKKAKSEKKSGRKPPATQKQANKKEDAKLRKRTEPEYPASEKKDAYRVDILLPLQLSSLVQNDKLVQKRIPESVMQHIHFYEGVSLAAQALRDKQITLDVYVHDINDPEGNIQHLINNNNLKQSDLIIGALQSTEIPAVADFAVKNKINFVSSLSPSDAGIKNNPYFLLLQPTLSTHLTQLIGYANKKFHKKKKYILHKSNTSGEREAYLQFRDALEEEKDLQIIDCSRFDMNVDSLAKIFDSTQVNVVYVSVLDLSNAEKILNTLAQLPSEYRFEIFGMPSWKSLRGLSQSSAYMNLSIYYTSPFFYDPTTGAGKYVSSEYKKEYGGIPSEMVYRGYESLYWMTTLLEKYGPVFNQNLSDVSAAPFTRYELQPVWSKDNEYLYLENKKLYIFHYQNGGYIIEQQ
jgi:ABC-type branched-subunit amino acid transport system substrate-binding protein